MANPPLDRWGRKYDLRTLYPDLTEDEALVLRALHEGDRSYAQHLNDEDFVAAARRLVDKGHLDQEEMWRIGGDD